MAYTAVYDPQKEIIMATLEGDFNLAGLEELAADIARLARQHNCKRIINDMRAASLTQATMDIYKMPESARAAGVTQVYKRAIIILDLDQDLHFMETVFVNQGHIVKMFTDPQEAESWLLG